MYPQRLPIVDSDDGVWGDILRKYLEKEHYNNDNDDADNGGHKNVTIRAGTAGAGGAPLKFTSGTLLTTREAGAVEFVGDNLYITQTSSTVRKKVAMYDYASEATGDIYYHSGGYFTRLPIGSAGQVLNVTSGAPAWGKVAISALNTTGTASSSTYLRGDGQWTAVSAGMTRSFTTTSGNYTAGSAANTDYIYLIAGAHTTTLPSANGNTSRYTFKNKHTASVTITRSGTDTIEGDTSISITPSTAVDLISNGTNTWNII